MIHRPRQTVAADLDIHTLGLAESGISQKGDCHRVMERRRGLTPENVQGLQRVRQRRMVRENCVTMGLIQLQSGSYIEGRHPDGNP